MKFIFFLLFIIPIFSLQGTKTPHLRFDGVYETPCDYNVDDEDGEQGYLRFYSDGTVISVSTDCIGTAEDLTEWFNIGNGRHSIGNYKISQKKIKFLTKSEVGSVQYSGKITKKGYLKLKSESFINGYKETEKYYFVEISNMK